MKKTGTYYLITSLLAAALLLGTCRPLSAQSEEQIERFKQERLAYFNENLDLTEAEKEAFWPLYEDFSNRKMKFMEDERSIFWYAHNNTDNLTEEEFSEQLTKIRRLRSDMYELDELYYGKKFPEILSARKVMKLYKVEMDYRRHLLRGLRGHGKGQGRGQGPPPGTDPGQIPENGPTPAPGR